MLLFVLFPERQYRCLGQWKEGELVYTYTQRRDVGTYECFVGSIVSQNEIYIKEAGEHCERDLVPSQQGMLLRRKGILSLTACLNINFKKMTRMLSIKMQRYA